jgi:hypothetical protein
MTAESSFIDVNQDIDQRAASLLLVHAGDGKRLPFFCRAAQKSRGRVRHAGHAAPRAKQGAKAIRYQGEGVAVQRPEMLSVFHRFSRASFG